MDHAVGIGDGIEFEHVEITPIIAAFRRMCRRLEFDVAEMSLSSYLIARSRGMDFIAIPVFPARRFFHAELSYHVDSGIKQASDVTGHRIGVGEYQQTEPSRFLSEVPEHLTEPSSPSTSTRTEPCH